MEATFNAVEWCVAFFEFKTTRQFFFPFSSLFWEKEKEETVKVFAEQSSCHFFFGLITLLHFIQKLFPDQLLQEPEIPRTLHHSKSSFPTSWS